MSILAISLGRRKVQVASIQQSFLRKVDTGMPSLDGDLWKYCKIGCSSFEIEGLGDLVGQENSENLEKFGSV
ncbi:hypothetical protein BGZ82_009290, partial [Podila clonocystis]